MKALIEQIMIGFVPQLDDANMSFYIKSDEVLYVEVDVALIVRLFENIIGNSIMYGKDGKEIAIGISNKIMNVEVEIKILDNVFRKRIPYVFEKFYRSEKSRSSYTGGKGMGLAISKV